MGNHCITCSFCDHSEGYICTLGRLPIDDPYSDSCASYAANLMNKQTIQGSNALPNPSVSITTVQSRVSDEIPVEFTIDVDRKADYRLCPDCQRSVDYDDMVWLDGKCTCPSCYIKKRAQLDAQNRGDVR